jgi:2'-5' RNA ligase
VIAGTVGAGQLAYVTLSNKAEGSAPLSVAALAQAAQRAGGRIETPPFGVQFDRTNEHGALEPAIRPRALSRLQRELGLAMEAEGIGALARSSSGFSPHVSLWYNGKPIAKQPVDPVRWTVDEFLLIDSLVGQSTHVVIRRWPLHVRQLALGDW